MKFKHLPNNDKKSLNLESYTVSVNEELSSKIYNHLFNTIMHRIISKSFKN